MSTYFEKITTPWPLRGRGGQPKRSAWPLFPSFFYPSPYYHSLSSLLFIIIHYYHYYSSSFTIITIIHHHSLLSLLFTIIIWRSVPLFYGRHFFSATGAVVWSGFCLQEPFQPNAACPAQLSILPDKHGCASAANQRQRFSDIAVPLCAKWLLPAGIHRVTNIHKSPFSILNWII